MPGNLTSDCRWREFDFTGESFYKLVHLHLKSLKGDIHFLTNKMSYTP